MRRLDAQNAFLWASRGRVTAWRMQLLLAHRTRSDIYRFYAEWARGGDPPGAA